eukprot:583266-Pleurochrysis_carterae.AAC.1
MANILADTPLTERQRKGEQIPSPESSSMEANSRQVDKYAKIRSSTLVRIRTKYIHPEYTSWTPYYNTSA